MAGDVILTVVFALVSLFAVDITADDMSELSDIHEGRLGRGGSNGERTRSSSTGELWRGRAPLPGFEGPWSPGESLACFLCCSCQHLESELAPGTRMNTTYHGPCGIH